MGFICYAIMLGLCGTAGWFTYRSIHQDISYEQGLLTFVPLFIASYWFSTFFSQLVAPRKEELLINKRLYNVLYWISTVISLALIGAWGYLVISKKLYLSL
ncbi:MAG: hypothetical protein IKP95_06785 [Ruminococcus sp.]|nr:hypothetical protein [Ruminococcus sp.]